MTVNEWRRKHRKCLFCKHLRVVNPPHYCADCFFRCEAKQKDVNEDIPRPFCKLFELKEK